jgi:hypothetical protein
MILGLLVLSVSMSFECYQLTLSSSFLPAQTEDTTPPTVYFISLIDGGTYYFQEFIIEFEVYDSSGIDVTYLAINGDWIDVTPSRGSYIWTPPHVGQYKLQLVSTDVNGNTANSEIRIVILQESLPILPFILFGSISIVAFILLSFTYTTRRRAAYVYTPQSEEEEELDVPLIYRLRARLKRR